MPIRRKRVRSRSRSRRRSRSRSRQRRRQRTTAVATKAWVNRTVRDRGMSYSVHVDTDWQPADINIFQLGDSIGQGDYLGQRDEDEIFYKGINIKLIARNLSLIRMRYIRFMVIQLKNNVQPPVNDLFQSVSAGVGGGTVQQPEDWVAGRTMQLIESVNKIKNIVLYDRLWKVKPNVDILDNVLLKNIYIPINKKFRYLIDGMGPVAVNPNIYILFWVSDNNNASVFIENTMEIDVRYREYFNK